MNQVAELFRRPRTMLNMLYFSGDHHFFQKSHGDNISLWPVQKKFSFIGRGGKIWYRGGNISKIINQESHRDASTWVLRQGAFRNVAISDVKQCSTLWTHTCSNPYQFINAVVYKFKNVDIQLNKRLDKTLQSFCYKTFQKLCPEHIFGTTNVTPRRILVLLNRYGCPNIEPRFFKTRFVRRP